MHAPFSNRRLIWIAAFSVAMALLEAAVVIYLRLIYYPGGFAFPLAAMDPRVLLIELLREGATIIMLWMLALSSEQSLERRLAVFLGAFAIWDLFYYVFLKLMVGWPESLMTWDILFLIPVPWVGPVIAPCIVSMTMVAFSALILYYNRTSDVHALSKGIWALLVGGSMIIIASWTVDYLQFAMNTNESMAYAWYVPESFNWVIFLVGELILVLALYLYVRRASEMPSSPPGNVKG